MADNQNQIGSRTTPAGSPSGNRLPTPSIVRNAKIAIFIFTAIGVGGLAYVNFSQSAEVSGGLLTGQQSAEFQRPGTDGFRIASSEPPAGAALPTEPIIPVVDPDGSLRSTIADLERKIAELEANPRQVVVADEEALNALRSQLETAETIIQETQRQSQEDARELERLRTKIETDALLSEERLMAEQAEQARQAELQRARAEREAIEAAQNTSGTVALRRGVSSQSEAGDLSGDDAFVRAGADTSEATRASIIANPSNTVVQGSIIEAALETGISSDLRGNIAAIVSYDVWSFDLSRVLIPRGSKLFGRYSSDISVGQKRVLIAWDRVVTPDGQSAQLDAFGSDRLGRSGMPGHVDNHFMDRFGSAALISIIGAAPSAVAANSSSATTSEVMEDVTEDFSTAVDNTVSEFITRKPTITVEHGEKVTVIVNTDVEFF